jgi:nucleoside-diphosphate-sugar epimerase
VSLYLVTGGAGFIGSNIVKKILKEKVGCVRVLDNLNSGNLRNLEPVYNEIEFIRGDIRDKYLVQKAVKDVDYILHHAALTSVEHSLNDPDLTNSVNIKGTMNLLTAASNTKLTDSLFL